MIRRVSEVKELAVLFLFNETVLDVGAPQERLAYEGCPITISSVAQLTNGQLLTLVREAIFRDQRFATNHPSKASALAAIIFLKTGANALIAVRAPGGTTSHDVVVRFADVSLRVLGDLLALKDRGRLTPQAIDQSVWRSTNAAENA